MLTMPVTLDVLKFSGWLNARVVCRVERRTLNSLAQEGVWGGGSARGAHAEDPTVRSTGLARGRRAHPEHAVHGCDARRVEVHRLVELKRVLSSRKEGMRCAGRGAGRKAPEL